ncbi:MAG TPA: hypothetical protein VOB72_16750 [Candidatus Dormibacteraeota bacterium]|nr:hypothetical protein [Candidatus Dormibacteraeota bacterium]
MTVVDLTPHFDNDGISHAERPGDGAFNIWANTFPAEELPESGALVDVGGVTFRFPDKRDGRLNNLRCGGQLVHVQPGRYDWIYLLAAAERRTEDPLHLHYRTGAVDPEWLRVSDFWPEARAHFGEMPAFRCSRLHYPRHAQRDMGPTIWRQRVPVPRHEELAAVRLPDNPAIHVFAMTLVRP